MAPEISKAVGHKAAPLDVTWNQRDLLLYVVRSPINPIGLMKRAFDYDADVHTG